MAMTANFEDKYDDIEAFSLFYAMRNGLVHNGKKGVGLRVALKNGKIISLEVLAEKYVNWSIFNDDQIYQTRYRPQPQISQLNEK